VVCLVTLASRAVLEAVTRAQVRGKKDALEPHEHCLSMLFALWSEGWRALKAWVAGSNPAALTIHTR
jgi:hypothetical protein